MTPGRYLKEVAHAIEQLFEGLSYYHKLLTVAPAPIFSCSFPDVDVEKKYQLWLRKNRARIKAHNDQTKKYFGYSASKTALCGAVLQIAFTGMRLKRHNRKRIPKSCVHIFQGKETSEARNYCIGRLVYELPVGLIIYAARNQYSHMDEKTYNPITERVFEHLALFNTGGKYRNPQFDLRARTKEVYADNILAILKWTDSMSFMNDMKTMLRRT